MVDIRIPHGVRIARNQIPIRAEFLDGTTKWRGVLNFEHATLCEAFGLDPATFYFDLPSSCRGVGSLSSGYGGNRENRIINGYIMRGGMTDPWGKLTVVREGDKIRDVDPTDKKEFQRL